VEWVPRVARSARTVLALSAPGRDGLIAFRVARADGREQTGDIDASGAIRRDLRSPRDGRPGGRRDSASRSATYKPWASSATGARGLRHVRPCRGFASCASTLTTRSPLPVGRSSPSLTAARLNGSAT
jgi:hypothetical protein